MVATDVQPLPDDAKQAELDARFGVEPIYAPDESYPPPELFPKRMGWVVRDDEGRRTLDVMQWGVPRKGSADYQASHQCAEPPKLVLEIDHR